MTHILLTVPFFAYRRSHPDLPDIGLGYLAACLRDMDVTITLIDWNNRDTLKVLAKRLQKRPPGIIAIKCFTINDRATHHSLGFLRGLFPRAVTILGGPHASSETPERLLREFPDVDVILRGEAEPLFRDLVAAAAEGKDSLYSAYGGHDGLLFPSRRQINPGLLLTGDLDRLDRPEWPLIDPRAYRSLPICPTYAGRPLAPIMATRGCPRPCSFCSVDHVSGPAIRRRSAASVCAEISWLYRQYQVRQFMFVDKGFSADRDTLRQVQEHIMRHKLRLCFNMVAGPGFWRTYDADLLKDMRRAGLASIVFGIESGSDSVRRGHGMDGPIADVVACVRTVRELGIGVLGFFMVGFPGERPEDAEKTLALSFSPLFTHVSYEVVVPFPGTRLCDEVQRSEGQAPDWRRYQRRRHTLPGQVQNSKRLFRLIRKAEIGRLLRTGPRDKHLAKLCVKYILAI